MEKDARIAPPAVWAELSTPARLLYRIIRDHSHLKGYCWLTQEEMAVKIGRSRRSVIRYLAELERVGLLRRVRKGLNKSSHYQLIVPMSHQEVTPMSHQEVTPMSHQEVTSMSHQEVTSMSHQEVTPMSHQEVTATASDLIQKHQQQHSSENAASAAAAVASVCSEEKAIEALRSLRLSRTLARRHARRDAALCLAVVEYCRERFEDTSNPVDRKIGFLLTLLNEPEDNGFERDKEGVWERPPAEGEAARRLDAAQKIAAKTQRLVQERAAQQLAAKQADVWWALWRGRWDALADKERAAIRAHVRQTYPLLIGRIADDEGYTMMSCCLRELEQRWAKRKCHE